MTIKRILVSCNIAMLLSVASLGAACEISCGLARNSSDCHSQQTESHDSASGSMKMDGMAMDGMTMPGMANGEVQQIASAISGPNASHPSIGEMGPCEKQSCDTTSAVSAKVSQSVDSQFHPIPAVTQTSCASNAQSLFHGARDSVATYQVRDGSPLHPALRI